MYALRRFLKGLFTDSHRRLSVALEGGNNPQFQFFNPKIDLAVQPAKIQAFPDEPKKEDSLTVFEDSHYAFYLPEGRPST